MVAPMITNPVTVDKFELVSEQVLPMLMVLMYLLPIYRFTSRLVSDGPTRALTRLIGVTDTPYWLSWLALFAAEVTLISVACAAILAFAVFSHSGFLEMLFFFWLYGMSLFGYIAVVASVFSRSVTLASVISTLFFFITSFIDLLVRSKSMPEAFVMLASILPTVAIRRAVFVITKLEMQRRGFTFATLNDLVYNFRLTTAFVMFAFAFFLFSALGVYLSKVVGG